MRFPGRVPDPPSLREHPGRDDLDQWGRAYTRHHPVGSLARRIGRRHGDLVGSASTNYANGASARGLKLNQDDWLELSADRRTVTIQFEIRTFIDEIRIITMASSETPVPRPAGLAALAGIAGMRRRRRR